MSARAAGRIFAFIERMRPLRRGLADSIPASRPHSRLNEEKVSCAPRLGANSDYANLHIIVITTALPTTLRVAARLAANRRWPRTVLSKHNEGRTASLRPDRMTEEFYVGTQTPSSPPTPSASSYSFRGPFVGPSPETPRRQSRHLWTVAGPRILTSQNFEPPRPRTSSTRYVVPGAIGDGAPASQGAGGYPIDTCEARSHHELLSRSSKVS